MAGEMDKAKGSVKDTAGAATGDTRLQAEGKADKAKGEAKEMAQKAKDAAKGASDSMHKH